MIDENLPTFYFRQPKEKGNFDTPIVLSQQGSEAGPAYILRRLDPASPEAKNRYAIGLYDAFAPDVLYGEVLLEPEWSQPSLSAEAVRANGGVAPPPQPLMPNEFTIQLYSPEQQVKVRHVPAGWSSTASWEFEMPQESFRRPSASTIDRTESDPTARVTTPMISMRWKRMGKFSKDLMCYLTGKSQNPDGSKKKHKEPDIPLSFFHHFSELTVYEPNVLRLDIEDPKGFEVAILLAATTIRDVFFNVLREALHIYELDIRGAPQSPQRQQVSGSPSNKAGHGSQQKLQQPPISGGNRPLDQSPLPPPAGTAARQKWEVDAETARLKYEIDEEDRARKRQEYEDSKRAKRIAAEEEKADRKRRAAIEKETERLRKEWEAERQRIRVGDRPTLPPRNDEKNKRRENSHSHHRNHSQQPYLGAPAPGIGTSAEAFGAEVPRPKSSLGGGLNIFRSNDDKERKMLKKKSAIW